MFSTYSIILNYCITSVKSQATEATDIFQGHRVTAPFGKVPVALQSPGPLRPLTFFRVTGSLGLRESPGGPATSRATEATAISQGNWVTGPSGKSQWPGKVPSH